MEPSTSFCAIVTGEHYVYSVHLHVYWKAVVKLPEVLLGYEGTPVIAVAFIVCTNVVKEHWRRLDLVVDTVYH